MAISFSRRIYEEGQRYQKNWQINLPKNKIENISVFVLRNFDSGFLVTLFYIHIAVGGSGIIGWI